MTFILMMTIIIWQDYKDYKIIKSSNNSTWHIYKMQFCCFDSIVSQSIICFCVWRKSCINILFSFRWSLLGKRNFCLTRELQFLSFDAPLFKRNRIFLGFFVYHHVVNFFLQFDNLFLYCLSNGQVGMAGVFLCHNFNGYHW